MISLYRGIASLVDRQSKQIVYCVYPKYSYREAWTNGGQIHLFSTFVNVFE